MTPRNLVRWRSTLLASLGLLQACSESSGQNVAQQNGVPCRFQCERVDECSGDAPARDSEGVELSYHQCENGAQHRLLVNTCSGMPREDPDRDVLPADLSAPITAGDLRAAANSDAGANLAQHLSSYDLDAGVLYECLDNTDCGRGNACRYWSDEIEGVALGSLCADGCMSDSDCDGQQICDCAGSEFSEAAKLPSLLGRCASADCTSDADCDGSALCLRTTHNGDCAWDVEYHCQTPADECVTDSDCAAPEGENGTGCIFIEGKHACALVNECDVGRPFLVDGQKRVACLVVNDRWSREGGLNIEMQTHALSPAQRLELAESWSRVGLMEHASIAAFARFTLQLLALGAPPELIAASNQALGDETRHAQLAFGLASHYAGAAVGPGPLEMRGALAEESLRDIVLNTVLEGCIGETVAAAEAQLGGEHAQVPNIKAVLQQIANDETHHAALAWRFVQWAIAQDSSLAPEILSLVEAEIKKARRPAPTSSNDAWKLAHGILPQAQSQVLRRKMIDAVVLSCMKALCSTVPQRARPAFSA